MSQIVVAREANSTTHHVPLHHAHCYFVFYVSRGTGQETFLIWSQFPVGGQNAFRRLHVTTNLI